MEDLPKNSKKSVYCQIQFLESIFTDKKQIKSLENEIDFFDIVRDSIIYFDKSENEIKSHGTDNYFVARLIKMDVNGECNIEWLDDELKLEDYVNDYIDTNGVYDFSPILFIYQVKKQQRSNNNLCQKISSRYGLMIYDQDNYQEIGKAFVDSGYAVKRNSTVGWGKTLGVRTIYGNSLVIIDDYLLKNSELYDNNLYEILDVLLPFDISIPFYITFIKGKSDIEISSLYKIIRKKIKDLRPRYFKEDGAYNELIKINIIEDRYNVFHDRVILTNYCWISCGSGFDLYNKFQKAKHSTNVSILYPFIQNYVKWAKESYLDFLNDSRMVYFDAKKGCNKWAEDDLFNNRLLMIES